jgi:hypothetical protein
MVPDNPPETNESETSEQPAGKPAGEKAGEKPAPGEVVSLDSFRKK